MMTRWSTASSPAELNNELIKVFDNIQFNDVWKYMCVEVLHSLFLIKGVATMIPSNRSLARQLNEAQLEYFNSVPEVLEVGQWHTPYIKPEECGSDGLGQILDWYFTQHAKELELGKDIELFHDTLIKISTGRCARTSYLTQEGIRDFTEDIKLHDRLRYHVPLHASPFEHVCMAMGDDVRYAKYTGWKAYRHMLDREYVTDFKPNHPELA